jgi:TolB protein
MFRRMKSFFLGLILAHMVVVGAWAELKVSITQGHSEPMPVALPALNGQGRAESRIGQDIMTVVSNDLASSGLFEAIDPRAFIEKLSYGQVLPRFADWRQVSAQALVTGSVADAGPNSVTIGFRLWDVFGEEQIAGKEYTTKRDNWRRIAHLIADEIYTRLTGEGGYFDSRIVYVAESGPAKRRVKRLAIMDQDGANHKFLTDGSYLVLTPRFSPSYQEIIYLSYARGRPRVHIRNLETGQEDVVGEFKGMSFAPRFSQKGDKVIMSIADGGNTEIYMMKLSDRKLRQLTRNPAIDTSPSYSPDGRKIVFNSDRGGSQQLYTMNADGSNVQRISFGDGRYGTPVWSPRGDIIAFTKMRKGTFYIGVMRSDGTGERLLTEGYLVEGPTWSPNGRVVIYARQGRPSGRGATPVRLYSVDITGHNERQLPTPLDASDPAWSGLLPL